MSSSMEMVEKATTTTTSKDGAANTYLINILFILHFLSNKMAVVVVMVSLCFLLSSTNYTHTSTLASLKEKSSNLLIEFGCFTSFSTRIPQQPLFFYKICCHFFEWWQPTGCCCYLVSGTLLLNLVTLFYFYFFTNIFLLLLGHYLVPRLVLGHPWELKIIEILFKKCWWVSEIAWQQHNKREHQNGWNFPRNWHKMGPWLVVYEIGKIAALQ